jgi:hypothetical protein
MLFYPAQGSGGGPGGPGGGGAVRVLPPELPEDLARKLRGEEEEEDPVADQQRKEEEEEEEEDDFPQVTFLSLEALSLC